MTFWLGTHEVSWLGRADVPLFVSHTRLRKRKRLPLARTSWALDSGGYTELTRHGRWITTPDEYIHAVRRYRAEVGKLAWCAPQDWMCSRDALTATGRTVRDHQVHTIASYLLLREAGLPVIPVLQGAAVRDYHTHVELYAQARVDLRAAPLVGLGSIVARQHTPEVGDLVRELHDDGLRLHGFGVKKKGWPLYARWLESADSMAWSYDARRTSALPGCSHNTCANCIRYALRWRDELLALPPTPETLW